MRTLLRVCCVFLLAVIIMDVTNSRSFNRSLTFRYSGYFGARKYEEAICKECKELLISPFKSRYYREISSLVKPTARVVLTWMVFAIKHTCVMVQHIRSYINKTLNSQTMSTPNNVNAAVICI